jgi:putative ABC transport system permease protein
MKLKLLEFMISRDEIQEIAETLKKNKSRTLLTAFGVFWGIFMLLLLLGSGNGLENGVTNMFRGYDLNSFHVYGKITKMPYEGVKENRRIRITNEDLNLIKSKFKNQIKFIGARSYTNSPVLVKSNNIDEKYDIYGVEADIFHLRNVNLEEGRYVNSFDNTQNRLVAVIGSTVKEDLYKNKNVLGKYIQIESSFYKIIGVFESLREAEQAENQNKTILIPHTIFQDNFNKKNVIDNIGIVAKDVNTEAEILSFLKKRHKVHPEDKAIYTWNTRKEFSKYQGLFKAISIFMWVIGIGTLLSGIVGVSNIMVINIKERTKEIGIRKAIGATPFSIIKMIVFESIFLTGISGYIGLSVGLILIETINYALNTFNLKSDFFLNPEINLAVVLSAILVLVFAGFFAAFFPARKAALIKPIEALREE